MESEISHSNRCIAKINTLEEKLEKLKGDQVPYGYAFEDRVGREQFQRTRPVLAPDHQVTIVELFTAPQKPVVLPDAKSTWHRAGYPEDSAYERGYNAGLADCEAAIEAAGIVVKDGE